MLHRPSARHPRRTPLSLLIERVLFPSVAVIALAGGLMPAPTQAATIVVTHPGDTPVAHPTTCTLRQAVVSLNTGAVAGTGCGATGSFGSNDRVEFANGLFSAGTATITLQDTLVVGHQTPALREDPPRPVRHLAIDAGTGRQVVVQRDPAAPHFGVIAARPAGVAGGTIMRGSLRLTGLTVQNGYANGNSWTVTKYGVYNAGGGLFATQADVVIERSTIRDNHAEAGGGVFVDGSLVMESSTVSGNVTPTVFNEGGSRGGLGGGLFTSGPAVIRNSTISGNVTNGQFGGAGMASKYRRNATPGSGVLITNSTISGNRALGPGDDGAAAILFAGDDSALTLLNSTIACNGGAPAAIRVTPARQSGTTHITASSTVFANTAHAGCSTAPAPTVEIGASSLGPVIIAGSRNLLASSDALEAQATFTTTPAFGNPLLGALQNNGGPTATHALGAGSPARNAGSNPAGLANDQRGAGFSRTVAATDIGAFEDAFIGLCGSAHGGAFASAPGSNLCSGGAEVQAPGVFGSGGWSWFCALPSDPANNAFCGARVSASVSVDVFNQGGSSIGTAVWGQPMTLRAGVTGSGPGGAPTGTLTFADVTDSGFRPICVDTPLATPTVCNPASLPIDVGTRQLRAIYAGSGTHGAASANRTLTVTRANSTTSIASQTPNPVALGTSFTIAANVAVNAPSTGSAYGTIEVHDTTDALSCTYDIGASPPGCALTPGSVGAHAIEVRYLGNGNIQTSMTTTAQTVARGATTTDATLSQGAIVLGQSATVTVHLATAVPAQIATPSGSITVGDGAGASCTISLPATSCALTPTGTGPRTITASYVGDSHFAPSADTAALDVRTDALFAHGFE